MLCGVDSISAVCLLYQNCNRAWQRISHNVLILSYEAYVVDDGLSISRNSGLKLHCGNVVNMLYCRIMTGWRCGNTRVMFRTNQVVDCAKNLCYEEIGKKNLGLTCK